MLSSILYYPYFMVQVLVDQISTLGRSYRLLIPYASKKLKEKLNFDLQVQRGRSFFHLLKFNTQFPGKDIQ